MLEDFNRKRHSVTKLFVHLVFTTKHRRRVMTEDILGEIKACLRETAEKIGCKPVEVNGEADYVHLLLEIPTNLSIAQIVNSLKTCIGASKWDSKTREVDRQERTFGTVSA